MTPSNHVTAALDLMRDGSTKPVPSDQYPCPVSSVDYDGNPVPCKNTVRYFVAIEYGDFGAELSRSPAFEGCEEHDTYINDDGMHYWQLIGEHAERTRAAVSQDGSLPPTVAAGVAKRLLLVERRMAALEAALKRITHIPLGPDRASAQGQIDYAVDIATAALETPAVGAGGGA